MLARRLEPTSPGRWPCPKRFARRVPVEALGLQLMVSTPEDTVLMKLRWSTQAGGSEKQLQDALGVVEFQGAQLDGRYLDEWAAFLGVADALAVLRAQAGGRE